MIDGRGHPDLGRGHTRLIKSLCFDKPIALGGTFAIRLSIRLCGGWIDYPVSGLIRSALSIIKIKAEGKENEKIF